MRPELPDIKRSPREPKIKDIPNEVEGPAEFSIEKDHLDELKAAICTVTRTSPWASNGQLDSLALNLLGDEFYADFILKEYRKGGWWYESDWRGKKGQRPTMKNIAETILLAKDTPEKQVVEQPEDGGYYV